MTDVVQVHNKNRLPLKTVLAGRYRLEALVASGGMGTVYRANDAFLGQPVAIKVLHPPKAKKTSSEVKKALEDLSNEARASIKLTHPNIVRTYNYERDHSREFLISEFVDGKDLKRHRAEVTKLAPHEVIRIGIHVCDALTHAREQGILHLDIKPANILMTADGVVKVCDFGLSPLTGLMTSSSSDRLMVGSPPYMSPEMIRERRADHRSDIYSLGATLYDLATGRPPFGRDPAACMRRHIEAPVPTPSGLPKGLTVVLQRALQKDPWARYQTAEQMRRALEDLGLPQVRSSADTSALDATQDSEPEGKTMVNVNADIASDLEAEPVEKTAKEPVPVPPSSCEVVSLRYDLDAKKWSQPAFPALDSRRTLVLVAGAPECFDDPRALIELFCAYPQSHVIGCSTSGEIFGQEVVDRSLSVGIIKFDKTELANVTVEVPDARHSYAAAEALARKLTRPDLRAVLVFSEGVSVNGSELVRGFNATLPKGVVVAGGLAGDGERFERTWLFGGGRVRQHSVVAVGLYGDHLLIGTGSKGGWDQFGADRVVSKSQGNVVYEIDGVPALALYERYLGPKAKDLPASGLLFPLAMRTDGGKSLVRTLLGVDRSAQSLTFAGDIPEGSHVQLMKANFDRLIDGANDAGITSTSKLATHQGRFLTLAVSCVGRRLVLGERIEEEVASAKEALPKNTDIVGFYSYGEISPFTTGACDLHNQTMTLTVLGESAEPVRHVPAEAPAKGMRVESIGFDLENRTWLPPKMPELDSPQTLVLAFCAPEVADQAAPLQQLARQYPNSVVVGCSGSGEIHGTEVRDLSIAATVTSFAHTKLRTHSASVARSEESYAVARRLGSALKDDDLRAVLVLSEGLAVNGSELVRGFNEVLPDDVIVTGGLAGDGARFERTWVFCGGEVRQNTVVVVGFYGDHIQVGHGSKGGWDKFGPERRITKAVGNVLHEIDGKPALELYKAYLGPKAAELPASGLLFPLSLREDATSDKFLVRTLLGVDESNQTLTFAGDVPEGYLVQLMKADFDRLVVGAGDAAKHTRELLEGDVDQALAVAISCVGRRLVLGARTDEEVEAVLDVLPEGTQLCGFYSYGELSPFGRGSCDLHNQTMTLTVFAESARPIQRPQRDATQQLPSFDPMPRNDTRPSVAQRMQVERRRYDLETNQWSEPLPDADSIRTLVLAFGAPEVPADCPAIRELTKKYPRSTIVGCSTAGEIHGTEVDDHSISVALTRFSRTHLARASVRVNDPRQSFVAGETLARNLDRKDLRGVLVLSEGLGVNGSELVRGFNAVLPEDVVITGGLSGDGTRFEKTWVLVDGELVQNVVVAVGLYGDHVLIGHGSKGGWDKFGAERRITRSEGNVLYEIDGEPALALYKRYLGAKATELPASGLLFPLSLRSNADDTKFLVRTLLSVDEATNSMTFAGDVPTGHLVQLMKADFDRLVQGATGAANASMARIGSEDHGAALAVAVSCVGRRLVLGARTEDEVEAVDEVLPKGSELVGFYSYGELSPFADGRCDLHNQTMTLTVIQESQMPVERKARPTPARSPSAVQAPPAAPAAVAPEPASDSVTGTGTFTLQEAHLGVDVQVAKHPTLDVVRFNGRITEQFEGRRIAERLSGRVVFDLSGIERITSFGVREWLQMTKTMKVDELYLARCSDAVVNQLAMIPGFAGDGKLVSFHAPYLCDRCGHEFTSEIDVERDVETLKGAESAADCPRCSATAPLDDDPEAYFAFATGLLGTKVPDDVRAALQEHAEAPEPEAARVEKTVEGRVTRIRAHGALDTSISWKRVLDGVEGDVVIELGGATSHTDPGLRLFHQGLNRIRADVDSLKLRGVPLEYVAMLREQGLSARDVESVIVEATGTESKTKRETRIDLNEHRDRLSVGEAPFVVDKRTHEVLEFGRALPLLTWATGGMTSTPSAAAAPTTILREAPTPLAPPPTSAARPLLPFMLGALVVAVGFLGYREMTRTPPKPAVVETAPKPVAEPTPKKVELPPAWTERPFVVGPDVATIVGRAVGADEEAALEAARVDMMAHLARELIGSLEGTYGAFAAAQPKLEQPEEIARRLEAAVGPILAPARKDHWSRPADGGVEMFVRYEAPRARYDEARAHFGEERAIRGLSVAPIPPTIAGPAEGVLVFDLRPGLQADRAGLRVGDVITRIGERVVRTPAEFEETWKSEWWRTSVGRSLILQVETPRGSHQVRFTRTSRR
ncbi:MAG: FIST N-terminal domain-containing protein [Deltaproteobacteria bacterium]